MALGPITGSQVEPERISQMEPVEAATPMTAQPSATTTAVEPTQEPAAQALRMLLDEDFADNRMSWPTASTSTAWLEGGEYRLAPRQAHQFVAVGAPLSTPLGDIVVSARFRKVGGPSGGGYGVIVRDQDPVSRDGVRQDGQYYVLEVGDRGEIGAWRRDGHEWVDLLAWTPSPAVRQGAEPNDLEVWAKGSRLTLIVNGVQVASQVDNKLSSGGVGVFVGGDGNHVALEHFMVRSPHSEQLASAPVEQPVAAPAPTPHPILPITRVVIPRIDLDSEAVPADLVAQDGGVTWEVPAFKIGHAQSTASAGAPGNAVLVGHVDSRGLGNVFEQLDASRVGDQVQVFSGGERRFDYRVVDVRKVGRRDVSVVQPTDLPSLTLITCSGMWLPLVADYAERLVVRAELASPAW
jgi:LPXTG-site transpeptidase (sortase) family protein